GVPGRMAPELPEALDFLERQVVAGQMEYAIEKEGAVPGREHEAIAIRPRWILRLVTQESRPQDEGGVRHSHRHPGMTGLRLFDRVQREEANGVDGQLLDGGGTAGRRYRAHVSPSLSRGLAQREKQSVLESPRPAPRQP